MSHHSGQIPTPHSSQRCHSSTLLAFACPWGCREVAGTSSTPSRERDSRTLPHGQSTLLYHTSVILRNKLLVLFLGIWFQAWTCLISLSQRVKTLSCLNQSMNFISSNLYVLAALSSFVNNQRLFLMSFPIPKSSFLGPPYWLMQHPESLLAWPYLPCHVFSASHVLSSLSCLCFLHLFGKLWNKSCCCAVWRCFAPSCIFCHLAL